MGQEDLPATADLVDSYGEGLDSIPVQFRSFGLRRRFSGPVVTLKCFEDNALLKATLGDPAQPPGCVLVVDGGGSLRMALVGDLIARLAVARLGPQMELGTTQRSNRTPSRPMRSMLGVSMSLRGSLYAPIA